jgi:hypothetical protein
VIVAPKGLYNQGLGNDSVIGYDVLDQFVLRIDYPRRRLWLKRVGEGATYLGFRYVPSSAVGAMLVPEPGALRVVRVDSGGAAARFGLRDGDAVVTDGDQPLVAGEVVERIRTGRELTVLREEGEAWRRFQLPTGGPGDRDAPPRELPRARP